MRRIIKETLSNGKVRYRVQFNSGFLGILNTGWHTDSIMHTNIDGSPIKLDAIFDTLEEAKQFCRGYNKITNKEIVYETYSPKI